MMKEFDPKTHLTDAINPKKNVFDPLLLCFGSSQHLFSLSMSILSSLGRSGFSKARLITSCLACSADDKASPQWISGARGAGKLFVLWWFLLVTMVSVGGSCLVFFGCFIIPREGTLGFDSPPSSMNPQKKTRNPQKK